METRSAYFKPRISQLLGAEAGYTAGPTEPWQNLESETGPGTIGIGRLSLPVKRNRIGILADILEVVKRQRNIRLIRVSYGANLPFDRAKKLLQSLHSSGLIAITRTDGIITYNITTRGLEFLEVHKKMIGFLEGLKEE